MHCSILYCEFLMPGVLMLMNLVPTFSQERDRAKIPIQYTWDLTAIYSSDAAWKNAKDELVSQIPLIEKYRGTLNQSARQLLDCLEQSSALEKTLTRLSTYASLISDQDTRNSTYIAMQQEISQVGTTLGAKSSFIRPEILKMDSSLVESFLHQEPKLEVYRHILDDILRRKVHTGTEGEEQIIADAGIMSDNAADVFGIFSDADFPYPDLTLSDGKRVTLDNAAFSLYRTLPNREDRKQVFAAFLGKRHQFRRTFGSELYGNVKRDIFYMKAHKYTSCLESALDANNIPLAVYHKLIEGVNANLPTFYRYLKLRKRMMELDTLHYYDLYAPLVAGVDLNYTIEEAEKNVLAALEPLGSEYESAAKKALDNRWIDFYPNTGKRAGAYSNGAAYDVHPYMLLNYNGKYNDMSTLAHELGHTMHSYLSNKTQPFPTSQYPIFVAEVASTFNEALLIDHMLKTIKDDKTRLSLLGNYLENIKGTVFRQTQFAEFELRIHELAEQGIALTGDYFDSLYLEITKNYYGHDQGICTVDDEIKSEWSYIPHFYYNFYVYQYATAFTASAALSEQVLTGDKEATTRYLGFLSSGDSDYPINLLKKAGVDMTTSKPLDLTMRKMNRVMDEMERILDRMEKK